MYGVRVMTTRGGVEGSGPRKAIMFCMNNLGLEGNKDGGRTISKSYLQL